MAFVTSRAAIFLAVVTTVLGVGCTRDLAVRRSFVRIPQRPPVTSHIVIVSIDGLRADAVSPEMTPALWRLARGGSYSLAARTISPSKTLPSHTSMLTGVSPAVHGITWNSDETDERGTVRVPTVFAIADRYGLKTAAFFGKTKFHHLEVPGTIDHDESPDTDSEDWNAERVVSAVDRYLAREDPNLLFVHLSDPDHAGHTSGWMTDAYHGAVYKADSAIARLRSMLDRSFGVGEYTLIVTADHGGHGRSHGSTDPRDMTIPWIVWGEGVRGGTRLESGILTMDTAATALWALGLAVPDAWTGAPVANAFAPVAIAN